MYEHLFGPVPSRRLGMSLGVDLIPHKICSLDCVYCECGPTTTLTTERKAYVPLDAVLAELTDYFSRHPDPDYITFSGAGEPTLHAGLGDAVAFVKQHRPDVPLAMLTNGTLLQDPEVRRDLMAIDLVLPSLDAATVLALKKINRPAPELDLSQYIEGLVQFGKAYTGKLWLEVFILPGFNDAPEDLDALRRAIDRIAPQRVQLNTLDRPGAVKGLYPARSEQLEEIRMLLGADRTEIIAPPEDRNRSLAYRQDTESVILETIARRPCTLADLHKILGLHVNEINKYLGVLAGDGRIVLAEEDRGRFYRLRQDGEGRG